MGVMTRRNVYRNKIDLGVLPTYTFLGAYDTYGTTSVNIGITIPAGCTELVATLTGFFNGRILSGSCNGNSFTKHLEQNCAGAFVSAIWSLTGSLAGVGAQTASFTLNATDSVYIKVWALKGTNGNGPKATINQASVFSGGGAFHDFNFGSMAVKAADLIFGTLTTNPARSGSTFVGHCTIDPALEDQGGQFGVWPHSNWLAVNGKTDAFVLTFNLNGDADIAGGFATFGR